MNFIKIYTHPEYTGFAVIEFNDFTKSRKDAFIRKSDIRSCNTANDENNEQVEVVFNNGDMFLMNYKAIFEIDGDTNISSQIILRDKLRTLMAT